MKIKRRVDKSLVLFIFLTAFSSVLLLSNESFKYTKEGALTFFTLLQRGFDSTINFTKSTVNSVGELKDLKTRYDLLKKEVEEYRGIERDFLESKRENIELKKLLDFSKRLSHQSVSCEIIGKDPSNLTQAITINKGSKHGIERDMPVVAEQDGLIGVVGKVISVSPYSSLVLPVLNQRSYIAGRVSNSRYEGLLKGDDLDENILRMDYVKNIAIMDIKVEDLIETSGMSFSYPKGYYIGRISSIKKLNYETSLRITVKPIIELSKLEYVNVLLDIGANDE